MWYLFFEVEIAQESTLQIRVTGKLRKALQKQADFFGVSDYLWHLILEDLKKQRGWITMIAILSSSWLGWCVLIIMAGAIVRTCIEDHKKRRDGVPGAIPFWASLPGILISAVLCVFCINAGVPYQLVVVAAAAYCIYVFVAAKKASREK